MNRHNKKNMDLFVEKWTTAFQNENLRLIETEMGDDCAALGFVMDCGQLAEEQYPGIMSGYEHLQRVIDSVSDLSLLGNAIYSKWRFCQHWSCSPWDTRWFLIALRKLKQLSILQSELSPSELTDESAFTHDGENMTLLLKNFRKWSASNHLDNNMLGTIAEFLVAKALHAKEEIRQGRRTWNLTLQDGIRIGVKSAFCLKNPAQKNDSGIRFGIRQSHAWNPQRETSDRESKMQSDFYVFCLLENKDQITLNSMTLDQWKFYILPTEKADRIFGNRRTIGLAALLNAGAKCYSWKELQKWGEDHEKSV